jgi:hypothetical protein
MGDVTITCSNCSNRFSPEDSNGQHSAFAGGFGYAGRKVGKKIGIAFGKSRAINGGMVGLVLGGIVGLLISEYIDKVNECPNCGEVTIS